MPLVHYRHWKKGKEFSPHSLDLDPNNYRFDQTEKRLSGAEIISILVEDEKVKEYASTVISLGYAPVEDLIVVEDAGCRIVIEGNRRLCAYKLLSRPEMAPEAHRGYFKKLKERAGDELPKKIHCVVAPNRAEALVYVYAKHTPDSGFDRRWQSVRQGAFIAGQLNEGKSVDEVRRETGMSAQQIKESTTGLALYRLAAGMDLSPNAKEILTNPTKFPWDALVKRIFGNREVREMLGVEMSERGLIGVAGKRDEFLAALKALFEDIGKPGKGEDAITRKYGTSAQVIKRVESFGYKAKGKADWEAFDKSRVGTAPDGNPVENGKSSKGKARPVRPKKDFLLPMDLVNQLSNEKLNMLIREAQKIELEKFYHSGGVFLRCIFEIALNESVRARGGKKDLFARYHDKIRNHELPVDVLLGDMKRSDPILDLGLERTERRYIDHLIGSGPLSYDNFNLYIHNSSWPATYENVKALREQLLPILRKALILHQP